MTVPQPPLILAFAEMSRTRPPTVDALPLMVAAAKAIGHPARLRMLAMLRAGSLCVCQLTAVLGLAASTVSGHLAELRRAGLVTERKQGKWVEYALAPAGPAASLLAAALDTMTLDAQARLDAEVVRRLRAVPLETLCLKGVDLNTPTGVRRVGGKGRPAGRRR